MVWDKDMVMGLLGFEGRHRDVIAVFSLAIFTWIVDLFGVNERTHAHSVNERERERE